jgi:hypothetical protein
MDDFALRIQNDLHALLLTRETMTMSSPEIPPTLRTRLADLLTRLVAGFGGAIEFWTVVCISQRDLGDPEQFIHEQWNALFSDLQEVRRSIGEADIPTPVVHEQVMKLIKNCTDLREVFDLFLAAQEVSLEELERGVLRLDAIWQDVRTRVAFVAALIPLPSPLPRLTSEQETYYQSILDSLFDRLAALRTVRFQAESGPG